MPNPASPRHNRFNGTCSGRALFARALSGLALTLALATHLSAADNPPTPTIAEKTAGAQKLPGYFNLYWDAKQGKLWLEIDKWSTEFL